MVLEEAEDYVDNLLAEVRAAPPSVRIWLRGALEELFRIRDEIHLVRATRASELKRQLFDGDTHRRQEAKK